MRRIRVFSLIAASLSVIMMCQADPAVAQADPSLILTLATQFTGVTAADAPHNLVSCDTVPGGAAPDVAGWTFDQPVAGGHHPVYAIGYLADADTATPTPVIIAVDFSGLIRIPFPAGPAPSSALGSQLKSMGPLLAAVPTGDTVPPGVAGGILDSGGLWMHTPADWVLLTGILRVDTDATDPTEFSLTSVCAPTPAPGSPTPSPSRTARPSPLPTGVPGLPTTGAPTGLLGLVGLALLLLGSTLAVAARRRSTGGEA